MEGVAGVQQAVRQNAGEVKNLEFPSIFLLQVQDYLRDLDNWTKQMEKKDEQLKQAKKNALSGETSKAREGSPPKRSKKTETKKDEMVDEGEDEMVEEIEDDLVDELVKKQYEDFPCPEVTAQ